MRREYMSKRTMIVKTLQERITNIDLQINKRNEDKNLYQQITTELTTESSIKHEYDKIYQLNR
jgi:hypothetical protein